MTKKEMFVEMMALVNGKEMSVSKEEMIKFCEKQIELLDNRKASSSKPTKNQIANEGLKAVILSTLTRLDRPVTIDEMLAEDAELAKLSNQKITSLLTQLKTAKKVVRTVEKKKAHYAVAIAEADTAPVQAE